VSIVSRQIVNLAAAIAARRLELASHVFESNDLSLCDETDGEAS